MKWQKLKKLALVAAAALLTISFGLAGCGNQSASSDQSVQKIKNKKTLVVGTSADFAPMEFPITKNGKTKYVGFDMMLANKIAKDMGVKVKVVNVAFPSLISELKNNKVDIVLAGMTYTPARAKVVAFSNPYHNDKDQGTNNVLLIKKSNLNKYTTKASLKGKSVGAQQSSNQEALVKSKLKGSKLVVESSNNAMATEVKNGTIQAMMCSGDTAKGYVHKYPNTYALAKIRIYTPAKYTADRAIVRKNDKALLKEVNKVIAQQKKSGNLTKMYSKAVKMQHNYGK